MLNTNITDSIKYIGVNDLNIDLFENQYEVPNGISYNSYIIFDDKNVIMDTVDERKTDEWLTNIENALKSKNVKTIDYLIVSHVEPDHSGNIPTILKRFPTIKIVGNSKTFEMIEQFYQLNLKDEQKLIVKENDILNLGVHTLKFIMAPMVHWPEVMVTYDEKDKILFSADGFGKFGALNTTEDWLDEARRYYINIVGKYGMQVQMLLKKASTLDIKTICPLHGEILNKNLGYYIDKYNTWSSYLPEENGILIVYASIHGHTEKAAKEMCRILKENGEKNIKLVDLARADLSETISDAYKYDKIILAASSYNMGVFPCMENYLRQLVAKNFQNRKIAIIENGTWAPSAAKSMKEILSNAKNIEYIEPIITIKSNMNEQNIKDMKELSKNILK